MDDGHMKRALIIALLVLGLVLAILLGLAIQGFTRATLITPLLYLAWTADLVFRSIPGWLWWGWFLVIALVIAGQSLRVRHKSLPSPRAGRLPAISPMRVWLNRISTSDQGDYFRWRLAHEMAELSLRLLAARDRHDLTQGDRPEYGSEYIQTLNAPPEVQAYLLSGLQMPQWHTRNRFIKLLRRAHPDEGNSPLELDLRKTVEFLEGQLERKYDD